MAQKRRSNTNSDLQKALFRFSVIRKAQHHTAKLEMTSPEQEIQKLLADDAKSRVCNSSDKLVGIRRL